jgi:superfamily I DNA and RNA helicase
LLLCFNKNLAAWLRGMAAQDNLTEEKGLTIRHIHGLYAEYLKPAADTGSHYFNQEYPGQFTNYYPTLNLPQYDHIIVDEAQDLFLESHFNNIDLLLKGGLASNRWYLFLDKENQNVFKNFDRIFYQTFCDVYQPPILPLEKNCRNTTKVIRSTSLYTGISCADAAKKTPGIVEEHFYSSQTDLINRLIRRVKTLLEEKVLAADIVVLVPVRDLGTAIINASPSLFEVLTPHNVIATGNSRIRISTPGGFKGLESSLIILAGVETYDENDSQRRTELYLSSTRATYGFIAFFRSELRESLAALKQKNSLTDPTL